MSDDWKRIEGTGWIPLEGFGRVNPRRDNVGDAGRTYFTAMTADDEYARALGNCITGGPETWFYEPDFRIQQGKRVWRSRLPPSGRKIWDPLPPGTTATGKWRCLVKG